MYNFPDDFKNYEGVPELYKKVKFLCYAYFFVNAAFILLTLYDSWQLPSFIEQTAYDHIPLIKTPVDYLLGQGNLERAALVQTCYSFVWVSFLLLAAIYVTLLLKNGPNIIHNNIQKKQEKSGISYHFFKTLGIPLSLLIAYVSFIFAYEGDFHFDDTPSYRNNMVHERNFDLFTVPAVAGLFLIGLSAFLFIAFSYLITFWEKKNA